MARIHTISITRLPCDKFQVRTDCGMNEGHYRTLKQAREVALRVVHNVERCGAVAKIEYINV